MRTTKRGRTPRVVAGRRRCPRSAQDPLWRPDKTLFPPSGRETKPQRPARRDPPTITPPRTRQTHAATNPGPIDPVKTGSPVPGVLTSLRAPSLTKAEADVPREAPLGIYDDPVLSQYTRKLLLRSKPTRYTWICASHHPIQPCRTCWAAHAAAAAARERSHYSDVRQKNSVFLLGSLYTNAKPHSTPGG